MLAICMAWLFWDPQGDLFVIPLIDKPVRWYGALFALGFVCAYIVVMHLFKSKLQHNKIPASHIENWGALILKLQQSQVDSPLQAVVGALDRKARKKLMQALPGQPIEPDLQKAVLQALNAALCDPHFYAANDFSSIALSAQTTMCLKKCSPKSSSYIPANRLLLEDLLPEALKKTAQLSIALTDRLTWMTMLGTVVGARLGHVFFYDWAAYQHNLWRIPMVWEGGLASHGGAIGVILALLWSLSYVRQGIPTLSFVGLVDIIAVGTCLTAVLIRVGNFFNQEIVGVQTTVPWAVIFGHPADFGAVVPRHPTQLYEAAAYLAVFCVLFALWKVKGEQLRDGILSGLFFIMVFGGRFFIEFLKAPQGMTFDESFLQTGQYLSIPFILLGLVLLCYGCAKAPYQRCSLTG